MSRDPRVGTARALRDADLSRVRGIRRASLPTQAAHGPSGPSELARKRTAKRRAAFGLWPEEVSA